MASIERRAYKTALYHVRDEEAALDIVQDAMMKLTEKYGDRPAQELPLVFHRIVQTVVTDYFRRQKVRNTWTRPFSAFLGKNEEEDQDPLELLEALTDHSDSITPESELSREQVLAEIESALQKLPARQREAFLLRYWEEMDVAETAKIMGCSEGSVKTHCSRAVHALAATLKSRGLK